MTTKGYYAYAIGPDGHIQDRSILLGDGNGEAIRSAERLVDGHDIELWQGAKAALLQRKRPVTTN